MDSANYDKLAHDTLLALAEAIDSLDTDAIDYDLGGDVLHMTFAGGGRCVVNTQRAAGQLWVSALGRGWHFDLAPDTGTWQDTKDRSLDIWGLVQRIVQQEVQLTLPKP